MKSKRTFLFAVAGLLALLVIAVAPVVCQSQNKVIAWSKSPIGSNNEVAAPNLKMLSSIDVVEIEEILVDGKQIIIGEAFMADDDWLKSITVRVKNVSDQRVISVQLTVVLPELGPGSPDIVLCFGCAAAEKEKGLSPGEIAELKMPGGGFYEWVKGRITEGGSLSRISKVELHHMYVTPLTGPMWFSGCVKTANPKNACPSRK
jgi:hypothetical protein